MFLPFKFPFRILLCGASQTGKSTLVSEIIVRKSESIDPCPHRVIYCAKYKDSVPDNIKNIVEYFDEIPNEDFFSALNNNVRIVFILDSDFMHEGLQSNAILDMVLGGRHVNLGIIFLSQNMFAKGKYSRDISLNCNYIITMKNVRDCTQIGYLSRQVFPKEKNFLSDIFKKFLKQPFPYLLLDLRVDANDYIRVRTDIFSWKTRCFLTEEQFENLKKENSDINMPFKITL